MSRPNSYDHKRAVEENAVAAENREQTMRVWDFIITRFDGTKIRLHPQRTKASVEAYSAEGPTEQVPLPKMGHAKKYGPGTFRKYVYTQTPRELEVQPQEGLGSSTAQEAKLKFDPGRVNILRPTRSSEAAPPNRSCGRWEHCSRLARYASRRH